MTYFLRLFRFLSFYKNHKTKLIILISGLLFINYSCNNSKEAPPFPTLENEYEQPKTKPFEFSKPDTLKWITKKPSEIKKLPSKKFSWDKLAAKPFDIGYPYSLKSEMPTQDLDWNSLPSTDFNLDSLQKQNLKVKVTALGDPKIVKAAYPTPLPQSSRGVTTLDSNFGLPSASQSLLKDKNGMLWFGSNYAIARYDGDYLQIYGLDQGLNTQTVYSLFQDSKGRIWVGTNSYSISVIDLEAELVYELALDFDTVYGIMEANDGKFWISNRNSGYKIIDFDRKIIQQFSQEDGLLGNFGIRAFQDKEGLIWLTTNNGVNILNLKKGKNTSITQDNGLLENLIFSVYQDNSDKIWMVGRGGVNILNASKTSITHFTADQGLTEAPGITSVTQDASGKFWLGSPNGQMFSYKEDTKTIERYNLNFAPNNFISNSIEDSQGQIWASAVQGGIYKIDLNSGRPANYTTQDGLSSNEIWSTLQAKDGTIWIGSNNGIDVYNPTTKTIKHFDTKHGLVHQRNTRLMEDSQGRIWSCGNNFGISIIDPEEETIQQLTTDQGLPTNAIRSIVETENGTMWMGGRESELLSIDLENSIFKYHLPDSTIITAANNILINDHLGNIWVGTLGNGIEKVNPKTSIRSTLTTANGLISGTVYSLNTDHKNNIWAATNKGMELINPSTQEITTFTTTEGLGASDVYAIIERNDKIFAGTSNGLTILKPEMLPNEKLPYWKVKTLGKRQGLSWVDFAENSFSIDKYGKLWAGVDTQILTVIDEIETDTTAIKTYITGINIFDKSQVFNDPNLIESKRTDQDTIWTPKGDKPILRDDVALDSSKINSNNITWKTVEGLFNIPTDLTLPPDQNYLSFDYSGLQYSNQDKVVYRYFLEGIDKTWSHISSENSSENYRDLSPGNYTFKVAAKGFNSDWGPASEFKFTILPPWWQTKWAYALYFLLLLILARGIHLVQKKRTIRKERERSQKRELEQAKEIEKAYTELKITQSQLIQSEKMASLGELTAGIAHEIQNPLNFVNNFSEVSNELIHEIKEERKKKKEERDDNLENELLEDISQNLDKINHHGKRADAIVKAMLQHSRNNSAEKEPTDINKLADEYLRLAYHGLRAKDKDFNATLETDFDDSIGMVSVIPQDIGRVILNLITNAFYAVDEKKKSGIENYDPTVAVSTKKLKDNIIISIKDNGNGIPKYVVDKIFQPFFTTKPAGQGTGLGLSMSYDIVKAHGGEIKVGTEENIGTTFNISLPISKTS